MRTCPPAFSDSRYQMEAPYVGLGPWNTPWPTLPPLIVCSPHWNAVRGANSVAFAASTAGVICCSGVISAIQMDRPCVPAMSSPSRG